MRSSVGKAYDGWWMLVAMSYGKVDHDRFAFLVALAVLPTVRRARHGDRSLNESAGWAIRVTQIAVIEGDGIGKEVVPEGIRVVEAAARAFGVDIAWDAELESVQGEFVRDIQEDALQAVRAFGGTEVGTIHDAVRDHDNVPHDVVVLRLPLGRSWQWSR